MPTKIVPLGVDPSPPPETATASATITSALEAKPPPNATVVTESSRHTMNVDRRHLIEVFRRVQQERPTWPPLAGGTIPLAVGFPLLIVGITSDKFEGDFLNVSSGLWTAMLGLLAGLSFVATVLLFVRWCVCVRTFRPTSPDSWTDTVCEEQIADEEKHHEFKRRLDEARLGPRQ